MSALSYFNEPAPLAWDVAAAIFGASDTVGGLYDPSSLDTLFQDANGTTPAVPGSPVGLVLDARKEMGPELKGSGATFDAGNTPIPPTYNPLTGEGFASRGSGGGGGGVTFSGLVTSSSYSVDIECLPDAVNSVTLRYNGPSASGFETVSVSERKKLIIKGYPQIWFAAAGADQNTKFIIHSIREVLNPPLSQPTTAARPILARMPKTGRRNMLTWTEDGSKWVDPGVPYEGDIATRQLSVPTGGYSNYIVAEYPAGTSGPAGEYFGRQVEVKAVGSTRYVSPIATGGSTVEWFDLTSGEFIYPQKSDVSYRNAEILDDGWVRLTVISSYTSTSSRRNGIAYGEIAPTSASSFPDNPNGNSILVRRPVFEVFPGPHTENLTYQKVTNAYDITEDGVPDTYSLVYDLADDALTTTLSQAINGDILIAGTKGSIIEPVSYAADSTFTLGPDTYTGGTPGIMRAIGDIVGVVLIDRTLTQTERDTLIEHYKGKGAKGLLVPGPDVAWPDNGLSVSDFDINPAYLLEDEGETIKITRTGEPYSHNILDTGLVSEGLHLLYINIVDVRSGNSAYLGANNGGASSIFSNMYTTTPRIVNGVYNLTGGGNGRARFMMAPARSANPQNAQEGDWMRVSKTLSVRELRPQEDW